MKVLYDHQIFDHQNFGGVSRYFVNLINHLPKDCQYQLALKYSNNYHLNILDAPIYSPYFNPRENFLKGIEFPGKGRLFSTLQKIFPQKYEYCYKLNLKNSIEIIGNNDFDVFHPTFYNPYFLGHLNKKPFVLTVHDMTHEKHPEFFKSEDKIAEHKQELIYQADHLISVSENTKKDIIDIYNIPPSKISVVYHGISNEKPYVTFNEDFPDKFVLYVGAREGYKNFNFMVRSISSVLKKSNTYLICTGNGFSSEEIKLLNQLKISDKVIHYNVDEIELTQLYQQAICLIYPSLYEGFGLPILEAFLNECPVLLSDASCFPEIADDAALYFDPTNGDDLQGLLMNIMMEKLDRNSMKERGNKRLKQFSWKTMAEKTFNIYNELIV